MRQRLLAENIGIKRFLPGKFEFVVLLQNRTFVLSNYCKLVSALEKFESKLKFCCESMQKWRIIRRIRNEFEKVCRILANFCRYFCQNCWKIVSNASGCKSKLAFVNILLNQHWKNRICRPCVASKEEKNLVKLPLCFLPFWLFDLIDLFCAEFSARFL